jgi:probable HAF family extracellular repeat protein
MSTCSLSKCAASCAKLIFLTVSAGLSVAEEPAYTVTDLGLLSGATYTYANDINSAGQIVGFSGSGAFLWTSGSMEDLGHLGGIYGAANDINDFAHVVGHSSNPDYRERGFFWVSPGPMVEIAPLDLGRKCWALGINASDVVVGRSTTHYNDLDTQHAFLWTLADGITDLGTMGGSKSAAHDINDAGQIVGGATTATSANEHAFRMVNADSEMEDLGTLGADYSYAYSINNVGQVVGSSWISTNTYRAFLWTPGENMVNLGTLGGYSWAYGINDWEQIVGKAHQSSGSTDSRAVLWENRQIVDLNTLIDPTSGWVLEVARGINNAGQITGYGDFAGQTRGFLLTPTADEPDGDFDGNGIVQLGDHAVYIDCLGGPDVDPDPSGTTAEECLDTFDFDQDDDLDLSDYSEFQSLFEGG